MEEIYLISPAPNPISTTMKLIHFEKIIFDNSVEIKSNHLQKITCGQKNFYSNKELSLCTISINILYVGNLYSQ